MNSGVAANNKAFINPDGYIEVLMVGDQTEESFQKIYDLAKPLLDKLKSEGKPLLGLIDMSKEGSYSIASDKRALQLLEGITYDKLAMCSAPHKAVAEGIIMAMGRGNNTKIFDTRQEALAWLLGK